MVSDFGLSKIRLATCWAPPVGPQAMSVSEGCPQAPREPGERAGEPVGTVVPGAEGRWVH